MNNKLRYTTVPVDRMCETGDETDDKTDDKKKENRLSQFMITMSIFQLGLSHVLYKQFAANLSLSLRWAREHDKGTQQSATRRVHHTPTDSTAPVRLMARLMPSSRARTRICVIFCAYYLLKYLLIKLLASGMFGEDAKWLDCYILGRFRVLGKTGKISDELALVLVIFCLTLRLFSISSRSDKLSFYSLEFLLGEPEAITQGGDTRRRAVVLKPVGVEPQQKQRHGIQFNPIRHLSSRILDLVNVSSVGDYELGIRQPRWIARPNRTIECWLKLNSLSVFMLCLAILSTVVCLTIYSATLGSIITDFGYELSYPTCVAWIRRQQAQVQSNGSSSYERYAHIYRVVPGDKLLADEMPIEKLPLIIAPTWGGQIVQELRLYNVARISLDIFENLSLVTDCLFSFCSLNYVVLLNSLDVLLNSKLISQQLELLSKLLAIHNDNPRDFHLHRSGSPHARLPLPWNSSMHAAQHQERENSYFIGQLKSPLVVSAGSRLRTTTSLQITTSTRETSRCAPLGCTDYSLLREITRIQAILHDHFSLVRAYDRFNNFFLGLVALYWLGCTFVLFTWLRTVEIRQIELEFFAVETSASLVVVFFLVMASFVHSRNLRIYHQVACLMAFDSTSPLAKARWMSLLRYYHPRPLFCFSLGGSARISRLFCLKLVSWVFSAFLVMASFFYVPRGHS